MRNPGQRALLAMLVMAELALAHAAAATTPAASVHGRWHLQSRFWVSLHQTLLEAAQQHDVQNPGADAAEREAWDRAVADYGERFAKKSPVFDDDLIAVNDALSNVGDDAAPPASIGPAAATLRAVAPLYRARQWPADQLASRFWMAVAGAMLDQAGEELAMAHERVYGAFPREIVVDVSPFGGEFGAYTTNLKHFVHTTVSTRDPAYQGYWGLEMMLHEASHDVVGAGDDAAIGREIDAAARALGRRPPPSLWHAVIFYTSGELTRRALVRRGIAYQPFILEMYKKTFQRFREPLATHWHAYLDGKLSRDEAIRRLVEATTVPPPAAAAATPAPAPSPSPR